MRWTYTQFEDLMKQVGPVGWTEVSPEIVIREMLTPHSLDTNLMRKISEVAFYEGHAAGEKTGPISDAARATACMAYFLDVVAEATKRVGK